MEWIRAVGFVIVGLVVALTVGTLVMRRFLE
jgi:hypothetical protein